MIGKVIGDVITLAFWASIPGGAFVLWWRERRRRNRVLAWSRAYRDMLDVTRDWETFDAARRWMER